jgi:hypothetical protein
MMKRSVAALSLVSLLVTGCSDPPPPEQVARVNPDPMPNAPLVVRQRVPVPFCGAEHVVDGTGADVAARQCLWSAYQAGQPAEFVSATTTSAGDPVLTIYRVLPTGRIEVFVDSTQDRYSLRGWLRLTCPRLELDPLDPNQPSFRLGDCAGTRIS